MSGPTSEKLGKLLALLEREPRDPFLHYGIAMEFKKLGDTDQSLEYFRKTIDLDRRYCYAYFQMGQIYEQLGESPAAKEAYRAGIKAATEAGDEHAKSEILAALEMIQD